MLELKELQDQGYVSKCGRWLKDPYIEWWHLIGGKQRYIGGNMSEVITGMAFYSTEHAGLARDTMEAEQICRKNGGKFYFFQFYSSAIGEKDPFSGMHREPYEQMLERFGEERLLEILNQELKTDV